MGYLATLELTPENCTPHVLLCAKCALEVDQACQVFSPQLIMEAASVRIRVAILFLHGPLQQQGACKMQNWLGQEN